MERYKEYKDSGVQWLGEIPSHWGIEPFGRHFTYGKGLPITKADLQPKGIPVVSYGQVHSKQNTGVSITDSLIRFVSPSYLNTNPQALLEKGDFAFADTSEDIEGSGNCCFNDYPDKIFAGYHIVVARPVDLSYPKYYAYLFQSKKWKNQVQSLVNGVKVFSINKRILKKSFILIPTLEEQEQIVSYLDAKTSKIDGYIAEKEKEVQLLEELKQTEIANVVTKGLNPNAKMKDTNSLISSLCPAHWIIVRNKTILSPTGVKVGNRASEYVLLSLTTKGIIVRDIDSGKGKFPKDFDTYQFVHKDELVFCLFDIDETPRTVGLVKTEGMLTGAYTALKVNKQLALPEYIYNYYLCVDNIKALKPYYSGLRKTVRADKFLQIYIPIPPIDEQREIVSYIESKIQKIDTLISELNAEIEYMKEYKQRLIADAVTGHINVQNL